MANSAFPQAKALGNTLRNLLHPPPRLVVELVDHRRAGLDAEHPVQEFCPTVPYNKDCQRSSAPAGVGEVRFHSHLASDPCTFERAV
uniref:Uncharacterized protein n=1 Tax=Mycena chlorophos TaxID=658473 RepID=A0ABQ0M2Z8_MYCCL|nr:predicted protein [Mycena chlorophos]